MPPYAWVLTENLAGLRAQAQGLAEAAGLEPDIRGFLARPPWHLLPSSWWPAPLRAVAPPPAAPWPDMIIGCGGKAAAILAALRGKLRTVIVQHPRMSARKFDLVVAARHDGLAGPNVLVGRTALHRATPDRLVAAREMWAPRLAHLARPLVAVLVGGSNGRFRLDATAGARLAQDLATMMRADRVGIALTPSRRTDPVVVRLLRDALQPLGGWVWDGTGENPYFGLLATADAIVVTGDSVSMISEAVATAAPVLVAALPGRSARIERFTSFLVDDRRVRPYQGRLETWPVQPLDDTAALAAEMRRRLGF